MIHPFLYGNGRIGRLLITFYLNHKSVISKPTLYLSKYFKKNRKYYYDHLLNLSEEGDYVSWIKFFLEGVIITSKEAVELAREIKELREKDLSLIQTLGRSVKNGNLLLNFLFEKPIISVKEAGSILKLTFPNAQVIINKLIEIGILSLLKDQKRNRLYVYREYLNILLID